MEKQKRLTNGGALLFHLSWLHLRISWESLPALLYNSRSIEQDNMTSQLASALALCLCGFQLASAHELQTCHFSTIDGVINGARSHKNSTAQDVLDCARQCGCNARCVGSFIKKTGACMTATLSEAPLSWTKHFLFRNNSDKDWVSFAPTASLIAPSLPTPAGLWMMDSSFRGRNLGSKGHRLDSSDTGLVWISEGPLGSRSDLKYARFNGGEKPQIQVRYSDSLLLDFTKPFTIALWVKTDDRNAIEPLLDGWNSDKNDYAAHIWFNPSTDLDQILGHANHLFTTTKNGSNKLLWRHIAAVYEGGDKYFCYLNATA